MDVGHFVSRVAGKRANYVNPTRAKLKTELFLPPNLQGCGSGSNMRSNMDPVFEMRSNPDLVFKIRSDSDPV